MSRFVVMSTAKLKHAENVSIEDIFVCYTLNHAKANRKHDLHVLSSS